MRIYTYIHIYRIYKSYIHTHICAHMCMHTYTYPRRSRRRLKDRDAGTDKLIDNRRHARTEVSTPEVRLPQYIA